LARTIFGVEQYDRGTISVFDRPVKVRSPRDAIRHGIAYLPEDRKRAGLILGQTIRDNASLASLDRFTRAGELLDLLSERRSVAKACRDLQVKMPSLSSLVDHLSGGNQQKVVLVKWLLSQARIFIFDEPTRGIDVGAKVEVYRLMNDLVADGAAVLFISSDLPEILGISDRILVMAHGTITADIDRAEATEHRVLEHAFEQAG
jgi:ribose transport system ATP-binding protein